MSKTTTLREFRMAAGLSRTELGRLSGVRAYNVERMETNFLGGSLTDQLALARALGVSLGTLFPARLETFIELGEALGEDVSAAKAKLAIAKG